MSCKAYHVIELSTAVSSYTNSMYVCLFVYVYIASPHCTFEGVINILSAVQCMLKH